MSLNKKELNEKLNENIDIISNEMINLDEYEIINDFHNKMINNQTDIPKEFCDILNDNFWELI